MCSELTPRARIPDTRIPQLMQPCPQKQELSLYLRPIWNFNKIIIDIDLSSCALEPFPATTLLSSAPGPTWGKENSGLKIFGQLWCLNLIKILHQFSLLQLVQRRVLRVYRNERIPGEMWLIKAVVSENVTSGWKSSRPHRKHNHVFVPAAERSLTFLWEK